jgi:patatin-like phospholipase/acyl hydrolase
MKKILSIDGGGIRGIMPAMVLAEIERRAGKRIAELFDLIAGTSTGGILALGLSKPDEAGKPQYKAEYLIQLYREKGSTIFSTNLWDKITNAVGFVDEMYDAKGIESVLEFYFGQAELKDALTYLLITAYGIENRSAWFFKSKKAQEDGEYNFFMRDVARATSAAPTYFEPVKIQSIQKSPLHDYYALVDGGMFANNPAMCAYVQARNTFPAEEIMLVSLGTGTQFKPIYHKEAKDWGKIGWASTVIDILFDGSSATVHYQLDNLLNSSNQAKRYFRFDEALDDKHNALDNATDENIQYLINLSERLVRNQSAEIDIMVETLLKNA